MDTDSGNVMAACDEHVLPMLTAMIQVVADDLGIDLTEGGEVEPEPEPESEPEPEPVSAAERRRRVRPVPDPEPAYQPEHEATATHAE